MSNTKPKKQWRILSPPQTLFPNTFNKVKEKKIYSLPTKSSPHMIRFLIFCMAYGSEG